MGIIAAELCWAERGLIARPERSNPGWRCPAGRAVASSGKLPLEQAIRGVNKPGLRGPAAAPRAALADFSSRCLKRVLGIGTGRAPRKKYPGLGQAERFPAEGCGRSRGGGLKSPFTSSHPLESSPAQSLGCGEQVQTFPSGISLCWEGKGEALAGISAHPEVRGCSSSPDLSRFPLS